MLTKYDLKAIKDIVQTEITPLKEKFLNLENKITDLEIKLDEKVSDLEGSFFRLKIEFQIETKSIKRTLKKMGNNQDVIIKHFDQEYQRRRDRVEKLETQTNLSR